MITDISQDDLYVSIKVSLDTCMSLIASSKDERIKLDACALIANICLEITDRQEGVLNFNEEDEEEDV